MVGLLLILISPQIDGQLVAKVDTDGEAHGHGTLHIHDGTSNTILVAEGAANASCADADGDGVGGLVRLSVVLRDVRAGQTVTGVVTPVEGDADESGRVKVQFHFDRGAQSGRIFDASLKLHFFERRR